MSSVAEQVEEAEAEHEEEEEAEAQEFDAPTEPESDEPDDEPEALVVIGPKELARAERARTRYRTQIGDILGEGAVAHECLLCAGLGYLGDLPPLGTSFTFVAGETGPELDFVMPRAEPDYREAPDKTGCDECDGFGQVLTGSKADHARLASCSKCSGQGWITVAREGQTAPVLGTQSVYVTPTPETAAAANVTDAWGRAAGHPHWGIPPAQIPG